MIKFKIIVYLELRNGVKMDGNEKNKTEEDRREKRVEEERKEKSTELLTPGKEIN